MRPSIAVPHRRLRASVLFGAVFGAVLGPSHAASAQPAARIAGDWRLDADASDVVARAIDRTVQPMNFVVRMVARRRLTALNPAFPSLRLVPQAGDSLGITWGAGLEARVLPGSAPAPYRDAAGERMTVRVVLGPSPDWLMEETYVTDDGTRTNRWALRPDGALSVDVTVVGPRLTRALTYRLVYRRAGAAWGTASGTAS